MSFTTRSRGLSDSIFWSSPASGALDQETDAAESRQRHFPSDEELIHRAAAQDPGALRELMSRYVRPAMRIAARILRDSGAAEEVAQEVFLYVHEKAAAFDADKGTARGWIVQLAYRRAFDRRADLGRRRGFYDGTDGALLADTLLGGTDLERMKGNSWCSATARLAAATSPVTVGYLLARKRCSLIAVIFSLSLFLPWLIFTVWGPETKGKGLVEVTT